MDLIASPEDGEKIQTGDRELPEFTVVSGLHFSRPAFL
jgi:hypothetical protein